MNYFKCSHLLEFRDVESILGISIMVLPQLVSSDFLNTGYSTENYYKRIMCMLSDQICTTFHFQSLCHQCVNLQTQPNLSRKIVSDLVAICHTI